MTRPMHTVSIKLSQRLDDVLRDLARRRQSSRSALVREALEALAAPKHRSVTAVVDALVETLDGPPDLSSDRKHMLGYGK